MSRTDANSTLKNKVSQSPVSNAPVVDGKAINTDWVLSPDIEAFNAYDVLFYQFGMGTMYLTDDIENIAEYPLQMVKAQVKALENTPFVLDATSLTLLAKVYQLWYTCAIEGDIQAPYIDPAADLNGFVPEAGIPFYPDFPKRVLDMDETEYRLDQARHYASTYGVETIASLLGADVQVGIGWTPDAVETTESADERGDVKTPKRVVKIVFTAPEMLMILRRDFMRPARMPEAALRCATKLIADNVMKAWNLGTAGFHENAVVLAVSVLNSNASSAVMADALKTLSQHPGDLLKVIRFMREKFGLRHFSTRQKKALCAAFETYHWSDIAQNLADASDKGLIATSMLSMSRFATPNGSLDEAVYAVKTKKVRSYAARVEEAWKAWEQGNDDGARNLLSVYTERPGVMLRSFARLARAEAIIGDSHTKHHISIEPDAIAQALRSKIEDLSLATLVTLAAKASGDGIAIKGMRFYDQSLEQKDDIEAFNRLAPIIVHLLAERFAKIDTPLRDKRVFVDAGSFSLEGSVVLPNETGAVAGAYPPAGMAYDLPVDEIVRLFVFWNDRGKRVDVDLHTYGLQNGGQRMHIGWNSHYKEFGVMSSGDITHSKNAAEYIDVDMETAINSGVELLFQVLDLYAGRLCWDDIEECYCGLCEVPSLGYKTAAGGDLYRGSDIVFHDDLNAAGRSMCYSLIDVQRHFVRILRGANPGFTYSRFSLDAFIEVLLASQNAVRVFDENEANVVLCVGREGMDKEMPEDTEPNDVPERICLIDEGFFIN